MGGVVDGVIPLDDDSVGVVKDALAILACKEIKLSSLRRYAGYFWHDLYSVLQHILYRFSMDKLKNGHCVFFRNVGEELADEGDQVGAIVATAQTKIISQVSRLVLHNIKYHSSIFYKKIN